MTTLIKKLSLVVLLSASINIAWQIYREVRWNAEIQRASQEHSITVCNFGPSRAALSRFYVELLLIVVLVGSRLDGLKGTFLSIAGLYGSVVLYLSWWQFIFRLGELAEVKVDSMPHFAYLYGGNPLDVGIAAAIVVLISLHVGRAAFSLVRPTDLLE
jgi:hypothetical protein